LCSPWNRSLSYAPDRKLRAGLLARLTPRFRFCMRHSIFHTLGNVVWAARKEGSDAIPLLSTYSRLKAQELLFAGRNSDGAKRTSVLGMPVTFFDYYWLLEMYEEIFLRKQYEFAADNREPSIVDCGSNIGLAILSSSGSSPGPPCLALSQIPRPSTS
jgi:hypothetical protein